MLRSLWRQALVVVLFLLIASCSGGGCSSGCSSCGITPIAGGFPPSSTITNAASVRVTNAGLNFLSENLPALITKLLGRSGTAGVIDYPIPTLNESLDGISVSICPNGSNAGGSPPTCLAEIYIGNATLTLSAATPDYLTLTGTIPILIPDIQVTGIPIINGVDIALGANGTCPSSGSNATTPANIPITVTLPLVAETIAPRTNYTKIDTANATVNISITGSDLTLCAADCGILGFLCNAILSLLPGTIASALEGPLETQVQGILASTLCTKADSALNPACPIGSHPDTEDGGAPPLLPDGGSPTEPTCVYDSTPDGGTICVPTELGLEGNMNLGALLQSISPGAVGAVDFALAANGNMIPAPGTSPAVNGMTLGMLGGALPTPQSLCVPMAANPAPTGLVIPNQMLTDSVTGYGSDAGPDIGVAIDGQFLNYFFGSAYNSGLLCLGVTTEKYQQLNTGLVSFLIPSIKTLTFEQKAAAIAITTRPQLPPLVTLGGGTNVNTDPLLSIGLKSFALDFYVWSEDRYIRAFTYTADLTIPMNIQSGSAGLQLVLGTLVIVNGTVTNNLLITDSPTAVATALTGVLGSIVGQLLGSGIPAINIGSALSSLGLTFTIPPGGIQTITQSQPDDAGTESYLGLFGNLGLPGSPIPQIQTGAQLVEKTVHPEAMTMTTMKPELAPSLHVQFSSPAAASSPVEYSWQIDQGTFSAWSQASDVVIQDPMLWMQAKHTLQVVARIAGVPESQDPSPAVIPFTIDVLPPFVQLQQQDVGWAINAWDVVSPTDALVARTRTTDKTGAAGPWTEWEPLAQVSVPGSIEGFEVQVRDEEGNIGNVSTTLIRGGPDPTLPPTGGCSSGCTTGAHSSSGWPAIALGLAGLFALVVRRRRMQVGGAAWSGPSGAMLALGSMVTVAATSQGCTCGSSPGAGGGELGDASLADGGPDANNETGQPLCGMGCNQPCGIALPQGLIGAYTSIAQAADGTIWVAGYNDSAVDPNNGIEAVYGDLVVGKYNTTSQAVDWVTVDGLPPPLPDDVCPPNDPTGWRGGVVDSGPDVGLWTDIVLDSNGHPMVSYYDATNAQVKFASSQDGVTWATHVIYSNPGSDAGRYSKMIVVNGNPVVAYLVIETGTDGYSRTRVSVAQSTVPLPNQASDWTVEDVLVDPESPCRAVDCVAGQACVTSTGQCTALSTGCDAACATGDGCISVSDVPTCVPIAQSSDIHPYPQAVGDYINLAALTNGLGLVVYDRIHGNLLGLTNVTGSWAVTILDGETGSRANGTAVDTGDDGVGSSLFVAPNGDWHVSYVDGITETLKYLYIPGGALLNSYVPEIVDTGYTVDGAVFSDGLHIIGDDSNVRLNSDGSITITYMDATSGALRLATNPTGPASEDASEADAGSPWTLHAISQPSEFGGFFPHFVPTSTSIENWWRWADQDGGVIYGNVSIVSP
ncbi:MAG: hypothetical protein ACLQBL_08225 [Polyangiaceae bacterium]